MSKKKEHGDDGWNSVWIVLKLHTNWNFVFYLCNNGIWGNEVINTFTSHIDDQSLNLQIDGGWVWEEVIIAYSAVWVYSSLSGYLSHLSSPSHQNLSQWKALLSAEKLPWIFIIIYFCRFIYPMVLYWRWLMVKGRGRSLSMSGTRLHRPITNNQKARLFILLTFVYT
jgi:hypothetical protein